MTSVGQTGGEDWNPNVPLVVTSNDAATVGSGKAIDYGIIVCWKRVSVNNDHRVWRWMMMAPWPCEYM